MGTITPNVYAIVPVSVMLPISLEIQISLRYIIEGTSPWELNLLSHLEIN